RGLGLDDPRRENAVLLDIVEATASGPGVEPLAAAVARVITEATATDVCFVHVLDDTERALTLVGSTPPLHAAAGAARLPPRAGAVPQARMHRRLAGRERAHERFVEQTVAAQEAERRRLAGEIHDGISQRLVTLSYHLDAAVTLLDQHAPADARAQVETACDL